MLREDDEVAILPQMGRGAGDEQVLTAGERNSLFADGFPRRVAHAVHALMEVRNDPSIGPYGPFRASEIVIYDSEALSAKSTAAALRAAQKFGLAAYVGQGLWTATSLALSHCSDFEARYLRETSDI